MVNPKTRVSGTCSTTCSVKLSCDEVDHKVKIFILLCVDLLPNAYLPSISVR